MKKYLIVILLMLLSFYAGVYFAPPKVVEVVRVIRQEVVREKQVEVIRVVDKEILIIQTVYQDKVIEKPRELKNFENIDQFLDIFVGSLTSIQSNNCLSMALMIQQASLEQGYQINIAVSFFGQYNGTKVSNTLQSHAGLMIETHDGWYFVDPTDWKVTKLF